MRANWTVPSVSLKAYGQPSRLAISIPPQIRCNALVAVIAASATRGGATTSKRMSMHKRKTAKHKLNTAHVHGALVIAGFLGLVTGSWAIFLLATGVIVATSVQDGSIRL